MDIIKKENPKEMQTIKQAKGSETTRPTFALTPFEEMDRMFDQWFDNFFPRGLLRPMATAWSGLTPAFEGRVPKIDLIDSDENIIIRAELPGVEKDNLDISVSENSITINEKTRREEKIEQGDYYRCEIARGAFSRTIALPHRVNTENPKAKFEDGVLELTLPKIEKSRRRTIKIE